MLRKLLKYEFKSVFYLLLPLYACFLVVSAACRLFMNVDFLQDIFSGVPFFFLCMVYFGLFVGMIAISLMLVIQRFHKGLLSEEGYLMFTLPVKPWHLIVSKGIAATVMVLAGGGVIILSLMVLTMTFRESWEVISSFFYIEREVWERIWKYFPTWPLLVAEGILFLLVYLWKHICHAYSAMAFGQASNKNRTVFSVIIYGAEWLGITMFWLMVGSILNRVSFNFPNSMNMWFNRHYQITTHVLMWFLLLWQGLELAFYYVTTHWMLSKHLNLQ